MNLYDMLRTLFHTSAAGDTFFSGNLCHTIFTKGNGTKLTYFYTFSASDTSIGTFLLLPANPITGYNSGAVRKSSLHCHVYLFLSYGVRVIGILNLRSPSQR